MRQGFNNGRSYTSRCWPKTHQMHTTSRFPYAMWRRGNIYFVFSSSFHSVLMKYGVPISILKLSMEILLRPVPTTLDWFLFSIANGVCRGRMSEKPWNNEIVGFEDSWNELEFIGKENVNCNRKKEVGRNNKVGENDQNDAWLLKS